MKLDQILPFRIHRDTKVSLRLQGAGLDRAKELWLGRGPKVHFKHKVEIQGSCAAVNLNIPGGTVEGLYNATVVGTNGDRCLLRNALMVLDGQHNSGPEVGIPDYYFDRWRYVIDDTGIPMKDMGGDIGFVRHPLVATYFAQAYLNHWRQTRSEIPLEKYKIIIEWIERNLTHAPLNALLFRHAFSLDALQLPAGWISGLTQGRLAELFLDAADCLDQPNYAIIAEKCCRIMEAPVQEGGLLAVDRLGAHSIEEYPTSPPNWALNGIGSAVNSLETILEKRHLPWAETLIQRVCEGIESKIEMFDCPEYPGSRVQLAMKYKFCIQLKPEPSAKNTRRSTVDFNVLRVKILPSVDEPYQIAPRRLKASKPDIFLFELLIDANRNPRDAASKHDVKFEIDLTAPFAGTAHLSIYSGHKSIFVGQAPVAVGTQKLMISADIHALLPMGIGRVARYDEPYHTTNLAWIWQLSRYGRLPRTYFNGRRWLYSLLTGEGRLPLAGRRFDSTKLIERRASLEIKTRGNMSTKQRAAETEVRAIDDILTLHKKDCPKQLSHISPSIVPGDLATKICIFGLGFDGTEEIALQTEVRQDRINAEIALAAGDELQFVLTPEALGGAAAATILVFSQERKLIGNLIVQIKN